MQEQTQHTPEMVTVNFLPIEKGGQVPAGSTVLQAAIALGVQLQSTCGGKGTCGKCRVMLSPEDRTDPLPSEKKFLSSEQIAQGWVLACKRNINQDMTIYLTEQKDVFDRKTQLEKTEALQSIEPLVRKHYLKVTAPSIHDQSSDWERFEAALSGIGSSVRFNLGITASLPRVLRESDFLVTAVTAGDELLAVEPGDTHERSFGLAIDIGTTTLVIYLMDLNSGKIVARGALTNPQQGAGADVLTRIAYAADQPGGVKQLQTQVINGLNQIIARISEEQGIKRSEIYHAVIVGNTTMSHLFLGIDPTFLAPAPFIPAYRHGVNVKASELGLQILEDGIVNVLPIVAGYVGSDTVGVMLAAQADRLEGVHLMVDIGTNGEMILVGNGRILTCSTAAGPAFEGAGIKHGMRAADGAIERVYITDDVKVQIIGNSKAIGVCGSGLIDAIAQMLKAGVISANGRLTYKDSELAKLSTALQKRIRTMDENREFVLVWKEDTAHGEDIVITQKDIRNLQLAKGAILSGINVMLDHLGLEAKDIDRIHLAGAFGNYIQKESALGIGLLPQVPVNIIHSIGNAAGNGAQMALLSEVEMERAGKLARQSEHIELSTEKSFQQYFVSSLNLA
ncbi:putative metal-binding protein [Desulfosporosinus orientis DSM 765]|uniref:Putative metal-binding protein n=2 Tax=Desulfosporosinus orientis TaxID=1563 RepID=G7W6F0_DESOD|nr:putative metal-binding protein [Desulfosporosinus orientis DSM 765]